MRSETWERLDSVFFRALELTPDQRARYLEEACGDDAAFRREVEAVLAAHFSGDSRDSDRLLTPASLAGVAALPLGSRVGVYELESLIGRGGMGEVYKARRADTQYEQQVAVKLMRTGRDSGELMRRFRTERQILARLQHPNIATLLDGGVTDTGQPFLVMQHVDGVPINTYANERNLSLKERLEPFVTVCDAVQFAHANLVVHRDLKPSNILITSTGDVRLLDFGIAKLMDDAADGPLTGDLLLLTPEHASPEQFLGGSITVATDVYALGVLLYELLTGFRPFQFVPPTELHRAVCERDPRAPSGAAADHTLVTKSKLGRAPVPPERIAGDLDSIVLKALRKEPERRYATVSELADDVRRHLNGYPVQARPETFGYTASRYLKRHKVGVVASAALAAALISLTIVSARFAVTSRAQAQAIAAERDVAVEVSTFLENLFKSPDPFAVGPSRRDTLRVRDFLAEGAQKVRRELRSQPLVQARLLTVLGRARTDLGLLDAALPVLEEATAIRRRQLGRDSTATAVSERTLGITLWQFGKNVRAESLFRSAEATLSRDSLGMRGERIKALSALGNTLYSQGRYAESEATFRHALALAEAEFKPSDSELAGRQSDLATVLGYQAKFAEAESLFHRAIAVEREANGRDHPRVATPLGNLATLLVQKREYARAEPLIREALAIQQARLPSPHPRTSSTINNLAAVLLHQKKSAAAESLFRESLTLQRTLYGERHPAVAGTLLNLAAALDDLGRRDEALRVKMESRDVIVAALGADHPLVATAHQNIGVSLHLMGRHLPAWEAYEAAIAIRRAKLPPTHPLTAIVQSKSGQCLIDLRRYAEAEVRLKEAFTGFEPLKAQEAQQWDHLLQQMMRLYRALGRETEAKRYEAMRSPPPSQRQ